MPQSKRDPISVETGHVPTIPVVRPMKRSMVWTPVRKHCGTLLKIRLGANRDDIEKTPVFDRAGAAPKI
jgi:hypothetical protein